MTGVWQTCNSFSSFLFPCYAAVGLFWLGSAGVLSGGAGVAYEMRSCFFIIPPLKLYFSRLHRCLLFYVWAFTQATKLWKREVSLLSAFSYYALKAKSIEEKQLVYNLWSVLILVSNFDYYLEIDHTIHWWKYCQAAQYLNFLFVVLELFFPPTPANKKKKQPILWWEMEAFVLFLLTLI